MTIQSYLQILKLDRVRNDRAEIETSCFDPAEQPSSLALPTLAGLLCVKKALTEACHHDDLNAFTEKDFVLGHGDRGDPVIIHAPRRFTDRYRKICVSISHTADSAAGLAALDKGGPDD
jgi:hypothetical protein